MTPAERAAKIAELRAEADRLEKEWKRNWPERVEAGMLFQCKLGIFLARYRGGEPLNDWELVDIFTGRFFHGDGEKFGGNELAFTYLGHACDLLTIKTPDAPEPTGAELRGAKLIGKLCDFSEDGIYWEGYEGGRECNAYAPPAGYSWGMQGRWFKHARLYREDRP